MATPSSRTSTHTLRMSVSQGNIRPSSSSAALGGPSAPRDPRRERRKPPVSPMSEHSSSTSPSSFGGLTSSTSASALQDTRPPSPPSSNARFEETYLAAKRRLHRQSYFDYYPERGTQRRREKGKEEEQEKEGGGSGSRERQPALPAASVGVATRTRAQDGNNEEEGDTFETFGRTAIRKSLSVGAGGSSSNSIATLNGLKKGKERNGSASDGGFEQDRRQEEGVAFPAIRTTHSAQHPREDTSLSVHAYPKPSSSTCSRTLTAPKTTTHPYGAYRDDVPALRFSYSTYSSSQTQGETPTPPQTPIEANSRSPFDPIHVVVAAPISGVEAMDALVDGMDGSDDDELFKRLQSPASKRSVHNHHPLYAPPLPPPPPGIVLGRSHPQRKRSMSSENAQDEEDDELRDRSTMLGGASRLNAKKRYEDGRSASSSTILADMSDRGYHRPSTASTSTEHEPALAPPPSIDEIIRKHSAVPSHQPYSKTKSVVPSISEIIRRNTQPEKQPMSRPATGPRSRTTSTVGRDGRLESSLSDSEPEPLTPSEEAALVARSSIDSVAAEVQQSLRVHKAHAPALSATSSAATSSASFSQDDGSNSQYSYYSYKTTRSAGGCDQSIRSGAASASASTSNGSGAAPSSPALMSDPELPLNFRSMQQNGRLKRPQQSSQKDAIANYLRSARITTLLKLTRRPHASSERPLTVSLSDLGSPTGFPLVVFLGLGCVRYVMGLYDEMAECLGLRLITIDRWGLGRTDVPSSSASRGVPEWSTVVDEVLDRLNVDRCGIMAHSAGAPYALSFASKYPERIIGDICLLAPWVGGGAGGGYRWLKYVPNGLLKTAQAAEWKIQAWMIGKPPKITYEGIGYNAQAPVSSTTYNIDSSGHFVRARSQTQSFENEPERDETADFSSYASAKGRKNKTSLKSFPYVTRRPATSRPSVSSGNTFSDYDDLEDFGGRFDSHTTFERRRSGAASADGHTMSTQYPEQGAGSVTKKKSSKGFLRIWKGLPNNNSGPVPPLPPIEAQLGPQQHAQTQSTPLPKRKLKSLRSISSLRNRPSTSSTAPTRPKTAEKSPVLPEQDFETSLELELGEFGLTNGSNTNETSSQPARPRLELDTKNPLPRVSAYSADSVDTKYTLTPTPTVINRPAYGPRAGGRRSISFTTTTTSASYSLLPRPSFPNTPQTYSSHSSTPPSSSSPPKKEGGESFQVAMGNALIAASHAESARGTHPDLLQILNHEQRPWGFSYARYPHHIRVWYGDRDERIAADEVKWMEGAMGSERCRVTVVKGADHGLMYRTNVVVDVLEEVHSAWMAAVDGSRRREHSSRSEPMTPSGFDLDADPFKTF